MKNKVAVITGGAGGIGHGYADACAKEGMSLVLVDIQVERLDKQAAEMREKYGVDVTTVIADVAVEEEVRKVADIVMEKYGRVDLVFNNAGIHFHKSFHLLTDNDWKFMIRSNVWTVIYGMRVFLPLLNKNDDGGTIINTSSGAALMGIPSMSHYNMAKFAVLGISQAVLQEEKMYNGGKVNILVVMPSFVTSNLMDGAATIRPAELRNEVEEQTDFDKQYEAIFKLAVDPRPAGEPLFKGEDGSYTVSNEEAGSIVMEAIKARKQYVYTHPEWAGIAEAMGKAYASGFMA